MKHTIRTTIAAIACAASLAGCVGPRTEPQPVDYQTTHLRTSQMTEVFDVCDASGQSGSDGVVDIVRIGTDIGNTVAQYEFNDPDCTDRRNAIVHLPLTEQMQRVASDLLRANDELRYATDHATWQYAQQAR